MPNLLFRGQCELSTGLQFQQKDQNQLAGNLCTITSHILRNVVGVAKIMNFILNFFPCLSKEYRDRKLGEWPRDTSLDLLSMCLYQIYVLMRFEFYLGWQKSWYTGHVHTVCICSQAAGFPPLTYGDQSLLLGTKPGGKKRIFPSEMGLQILNQ